MGKLFNAHDDSMLSRWRQWAKQALRQAGYYVGQMEEYVHDGAHDDTSSTHF